MSGRDLAVLATAFELCQDRLRLEGWRIGDLADALGGQAGVLGDESVGGDAASTLGDRVRTLAGQLRVLGGRDGLEGVAGQIAAVLDRFQEVDRAQATNSPRRAG